MDHKKEGVLLFMLMLGIVFFSFNSGFTGSAISEGVFEGSVVIDNAQEGITYADSFPLSLQSSDVIHLEISPTGEARSWIVLEDTSLMILPEVENEIPFRVVVPQGIEQGEYSAKLVLLYVDDPAKKGAVLNDQILEYVDVTIIVSGSENTGTFIESFVIFDTEEGQDVDYLLRVQNTGNVEETKAVKLEVFDSSNRKVTEVAYNSPFYGYELKDLDATIISSLDQGEYTGRLEVGSKVLETAFTIQPESSFTRKGELLNLNVEVNEDNSVTIKGFFENKGESVLEAEMKGEIFFGEEEDLIHSFITPEAKVYPGDIYIFEEEYTDSIDGKYTLDVEVTSDQFVLDESQTVFYSTNAVSLGANFVVIFSLILFLLVISHHLLSRRKNE
jgi:hypothetical protein